VRVNTPPRQCAPMQGFGREGRLVLLNFLYFHESSLVKKPRHAPSGRFLFDPIYSAKSSKKRPPEGGLFKGRLSSPLSHQERRDKQSENRNHFDKDVERWA
jgi:hypothetical protein